MRLSPSALLLAAAFVTYAGSHAGCNTGALGSDPTADLSKGAGDGAIQFPPPPDLAMAACDPGPDPCGDTDCKDPTCMDTQYGPPTAPFSLQADATPNPLEQDYSLIRDVNGYLDLRQPTYNYLWVPNTTDLNTGTISKIDSKAVREVARYYSTTCFSLKTGSRAACDGLNGCCSTDDDARYQARKNKQAEPPHGAVQRAANSPSRTAVDDNGDLLVANRAPGGQSSVTRIANYFADCVDRNGNTKIDTSSDQDGNGFIEVDCNGDGLPDDLSSVKSKPCKNGLTQEFYGQDDECVLWTANTFAPNAVGAALGLGFVSNTSIAWAGSSGGRFVALSAESGLAIHDAQLPVDCQGSPIAGVTVDPSGVAWVTHGVPDKLCYFDTKNTGNAGFARDAMWGPSGGAGITMDRDQNIWLGGTAARYTPDRSNNSLHLGQGWWTRIGSETATSVAADSRNANAYFTYLCQGSGVLQIPASTIKFMKADQTVPNNAWPSVKMPCLAVAIDSDQNLWGVSGGLSTRALIDFKGVITPPSVNGPPNGNNVCPAGDSCANVGADPYSDFTEYRPGYISPVGGYQMLVPGCISQGASKPHDTQWFAVNYDADVPPNTALTVHARSGDSEDLKDPSWAARQWSMDASSSPAMLQGALTPNVSPDDPTAVVHDSWLQVELVLKTQAHNATAVLKRFDVAFKCSP